MSQWIYRNRRKFRQAGERENNEIMCFDVRVHIVQQVELLQKLVPISCVMRVDAKFAVYKAVMKKLSCKKLWTKSYYLVCSKISIKMRFFL